MLCSVQGWAKRGCASDTTEQTGEGAKSAAGDRNDMAHPLSGQTHQLRRRLPGQQVGLGKVKAAAPEVLHRYDVGCLVFCRFVGLFYKCLFLWNILCYPLCDRLLYQPDLSWHGSVYPLRERKGLVSSADTFLELQLLTLTLGGFGSPCCPCQCCSLGHTAKRTLLPHSFPSC